MRVTLQWIVAYPERSESFFLQKSLAKFALMETSNLSEFPKQEHFNLPPSVAVPVSARTVIRTRNASVASINLNVTLH